MVRIYGALSRYHHLSKETIDGLSISTYKDLGPDRLTFWIAVLEEMAKIEKEAHGD